MLLITALKYNITYLQTLKKKSLCINYINIKLISGIINKITEPELIKLKHGVNYDLSI